MKLNGLRILGFFSFVLAGCAGPPNLVHLEQKQRAIDQINQLLKKNNKNSDEFEYFLSSNEECFVTVSVKWPTWRLNDSNYSDAVTFYKFDWSEIGLVSHKASEEKRPPNYNESRHSYISIDFIHPRRYKTVATGIGGEKYDGMGFADGLELYVYDDGSPYTHNIIEKILNTRNNCSINPGRVESQDLDANSPEDQYQLGNAYLHSRHPAPKSALAYELYLKAAQRGNLNSQLQMGNALRSGLNGVPKDLMAARYWFEAAAVQGSPLALDMLGDFYEKGVGGVNADPVKAADYYRLAANRGVVTAQESLAEMLHFGKGIPKNIIEAREWYSKAAEAGSESAQKAMSLMDKNE